MGDSALKMSDFAPQDSGSETDDNEDSSATAAETPPQPNPEGQTTVGASAELSTPSPDEQPATELPKPDFNPESLDPPPRSALIAPDLPDLLPPFAQPEPKVWLGRIGKKKHEYWVTDRDNH